MEVESMKNKALVDEFKRLTKLAIQGSLRLLEIEQEISRRVGDETEAKRLLINMRTCISLNKGGVKIAKCEKELLKTLNTEKETILPNNNPIPEEGFVDYY